MNQLGEMEIKIGKSKFLLKATFLGLVEMENRACTGTGGLSYRLISKTMGVNDVAAIIYGGIIGKLGPDKNPSIEYETLGEEIFRHGIKELIGPCEEFLTYAMTGGKDQESVKKKAKSDS